MSWLVPAMLNAFAIVIMVSAWRDRDRSPEAYRRHSKRVSLLAVGVTLWMLISIVRLIGVFGMPLPADRSRHLAVMTGAGLAILANILVSAALPLIAGLSVVVTHRPQR